MTQQKLVLHFKEACLNTCIVQAAEHKREHMHVRKPPCSQKGQYFEEGCDKALLTRARMVLTGCRESQKGPREV